MNAFKRFIIGLTALTAFMALNTDARAQDICNPNNIDTHYKALYCAIGGGSPEDLDDDIIEILSTQFSMEEEIIKEILSNSICETVKDYDEEKKKKLPESVRNICLTSGLSTTEVIGGWSVFSDIRDSYNKERAIQQSAATLKFKFKASEQFWNGTLTDAPFDLILDLNLIEIVLFGSKAQWMSDVFKFPLKEDEDETGTPPADGLLPEEGDPEKDEGPTDPGDPGLTVTDEEGSEIPPDCVLPNDPDADLGDKPGSTYHNPLCGNGILDVLMGEECDDGNTVSGDGCNQYCKIEATGSNDICIDPDAVTFKKPVQGQTAGTGGSDGSGSTTPGQTGTTPACPPGTVPKSGAGISGQEAAPPKEIPQSPEYPGPFLGGTLKQYGDSNRPLCGPGESPLAIDTPKVETKNEEGEDDFSISSETQYLKDDDGKVRCIPTEFCMDPDITRALLFGANWKVNPETEKMAQSIESLFCVNIIKANRPMSPYQMIEGCIDCHITAMVDSLEKALQTNVSPLQNTMNAFGISNRFGPNMSFNLNTATKSKLKYYNTGTMANAIKRAEENTATWRNERVIPEKHTDSLQGPLAQLKKTTQQAQQAQDNILENTRIHKMSNEVISDQEVGGRVIPLINQMRDSFATIQAKFESIIGATALDQKKPCQK